MSAQPNLQILRFAMISSTVMIAGAMILLRAAGLMAEVGDYGIALLVAMVIIILSAGFMVSLIRGRIAAAQTPERRSALTIMGWTLGEGPAIAGSAFYLISGDILLMWAGMLFGALVFYIIQTPRANQPSGL